MAESSPRQRSVGDSSYQREESYQGRSEGGTSYQRSDAASNVTGAAGKDKGRKVQVIPAHHPGLRGTKDKVDSLAVSTLRGGKFPQSDKLKAGCCRCLYGTQSKIEEISSEALGPLFSFDEYFQEGKDEAAGRALKLTIKGTGILEMDENILHPFVRVHIVDLETKKYLAKSEWEDPGVANRESCSFFQVNAEDK